MSIAPEPAYANKVAGAINVLVVPEAPFHTIFLNTTV